MSESKMDARLRGPRADLLTAEGNVDVYARLMGDLDFTKTKYGWYKGVVAACVPGQKLQDLFVMEGFSCTKLIPMEDGKPGYHKVLREVGFYRELKFGKSGDIMDTWHNPMIDETVKVVPIANDPFNYDITPVFYAAPSYGGQNKDDPSTKPFEIPLILPWEDQVYRNKARLDSHIHLHYPARLQPSEWPRESAGEMNQVSEYTFFEVDTDDIQNPDNTSLHYSGSWVRVNPWLPWMMMGQAPGHVLYTCYTGSMDSLDDLPRDLVEAAEKLDPKFLEAPTEVYGPSLSSMENYALTQTPMPVKS
ncbi:MAG: hypothetical protein ACJAYG_000215 [Oceanicoccus sp.]|jgi:hypothetical protein